MVINIIHDVQNALDEDIGSGDVTAALLPANLDVEATIISREAMLVCGQPWVNATFREMSARVQVDWFVKEASWQAVPTTLCQIRGPVREILTAERTALNFLQTLSATATQTYHYVQQLEGYHTRLLDTRKTLPGLRQAQKYAVVCGGGMNHRMGLYDAFLLKENHIKASGSIRVAIQRARMAKQHLFVEIEVETLEELKEALEAQPDRIMLDNFDLPSIQAAVLLAKPYGCPLEVSGNINQDTIQAIAETGVDFISVGSLTKSIRAIDLSLRITSTIC